jgi:hypothetical protein
MGIGAGLEPTCGTGKGAVPGGAGVGTGPGPCATLIGASVRPNAAEAHLGRRWSRSRSVSPISYRPRFDNGHGLSGPEQSDLKSGPARLHHEVVTLENAGHRLL